ncbi:MAG TPA: 2-C-methyl-D-erythritol 4-phosphate cytidylyltransferase, partial [Terricaulis sp.]|nr:2-C-methyl-D-erythritol 4-phosphate cytidylyltransferase [Terricaulis sp.]
MTSAALIVAAGRGQRAGAELPKQYSVLGGKPVLAWSIDAFVAAGVDEIFVAIDPAHEDLCRAAIGGRPVRLIAGGASR